MYTPAELQLSEQIPEIAQKFYTIHGAQQDVFQLPELLNKLSAIFVDIRYTAPVQPLKWNKNYLKLLLKNRYLHLPSLGNRATVKYPGEQKPVIHNLALGIKIITELKVNILLFCNCEKEEHCHLNIIISELRKKGNEVEKVIA